ncbi:MAG: hypothetical protein FJ095_15660 [Deltaproteobacteria bacterium]|nr:hypothetical protein [Deltaproteobacteria bacterium]
MFLTREQLMRVMERHVEATASAGATELVEVEAVDVAGGARGEAKTGASRRIAVLWNVTQTSIVERLEPDDLPCERIYCPLGVLEPREEGLVIVALAPGVSAVELQSRVSPTLKITPLVQEMVLD